MSNVKLRTLLGATALMAASALSMGANAATIYGGGSSLVAPVWGQIKYCWSNPQNNHSGKAFYLNKPAATPLPNTNVPVDVTPTTCESPSHTATFPNTILYVSTGSGVGQAAVFGHNGAAIPSTGSQPLLGWVTATTPQATTTVGIQYGMSDNALAQADLDVYNFGTGHAAAPVTPASYQGVTIPAAKAKYGALVQFPVSIDPVDLAFNATYATGHTLNLTNNGGKLVLDKASYCGIYKGTIKDWSDSTLATANGFTGAGTSTLTGTAANGTSAPITVFGRADSSGTTSIFTRHLFAVCGSGSPWTGGTTTLPTAGVSTTYTLATGSGGVAAGIAGQVGAIGYLGNDYIATTGGLPVATLVNASNQKVAPSGAAAAIAFGALTAPSVGDTNQLDWVAAPNDLHIGNPSTSGAYPIVGTSNFLGYTCYNAVGTVNTLRELLGFTYDTTTNRGATLLTSAGLAPLPATWVSAINNTFLTVSGSGNLSLYLATAQVSSGNIDGINTNASCNVSGVGGA